jgi:hypothetical protein
MRKEVKILEHHAHLSRIPDIGVPVGHGSSSIQISPELKTSSR